MSTQPSHPLVKTLAATAALSPVVLIAACSSSGGDYTDFGHGVCNIDGATANKATYKDGHYSQDGSYQTHVTEEYFTATIDLKDGIVTAVTSSADSPNQRSLGLQKSFAGALEAKIVGCPIESVSINVLGGASLTSKEFNNMVEKIRQQARA